MLKWKQKYGGFVSKMRDAIIECSISELQRDGLKFSIDRVAKSLKISKKTIYKYFATKKELAVAIYSTFYEKALAQMQEFYRGCLDENDAAQMLEVYFQSFCMIRKDIFNKYALNENVYLFAKSNHDKIGLLLKNHLPQSDRAAFAVIIDGSLQRLCEVKEDTKIIIGILVKLIC